MLEKVGDKINYWTITRIFTEYKYGQNITFCDVRCDCGNNSTVKLTAVRNGKSKSCGCYRDKMSSIRASELTKTHDLSKHPIYRVWTGMRSRCKYPSSSSYKNYGGRGIKVCDEWEKDFIIFYNWAIVNGWKEGLQLDRINNDGNYEPSNCQFVSRKENIDNRRITVSMTAFGETKTIREWSLDKRCKCSYGSLLYRIQNNWKPEIALNKPTPNTDNFRAYKTFYDFAKEKYPEILEEFLNQ